MVAAHDGCLSPNELFVNTRAYMGSCGKEHCEYTKFRFDQMEDGREKREIIDRSVEAR